MATLKQRIASLISVLIDKLNDLNKRKIDEAPDDGGRYVRKEQEWVPESPGGVSDASEVSYHNPSFPTVEDALDELLYVAPSITSFTNNAGSPVRMGKVITSVKFDWVINKGILTQSINQGVGTIEPNSLRTKTITGQNITDNITYRLTVNDGSRTATRDTAISFRNDRYWGTSPNPTLTNAQVLSLNKELDNSRAKQFLQDGNGEYIYYAWRKAGGALVKMEVNGLGFTAYNIVTQSVTNSEGFTEDYYVLRTSTVQNGTLDIKIS